MYEEGEMMTLELFGFGGLRLSQLQIKIETSQFGIKPQLKSRLPKLCNSNKLNLSKSFPQSLCWVIHTI